jgi:hypothetical protein
LVLAGQGVDGIDIAGAEFLDVDPVDAAERLSASSR